MISEVQPDRDGYRVKSFLLRIEGLFARIERWTCCSTGVPHWCSISGDNILTISDINEHSRIAGPKKYLRVFSWLICRSYDGKGNAIISDYVAENDAKGDLSLACERRKGP